MQFISDYQLQRHDPLRLPSWRWQWAQAFIASGRPRPRNLDDEAIAALAFARALDRGDSASGSGRLKSSVAALAVYQRPCEQRDLLEAWVLSGATDCEIAQQLNIEPAVVAEYSMLFFDVRDQLYCLDWIMFAAIRWSPEGPRDMETVIKAVAYSGGPLVLQVVMAALGMTGARSTRYKKISIAEPLADRIRLLVDLLANPPRGVLALRMLNQLEEINARRLQPAGGCPQQSPVDAAIACALDQLDWNRVFESDADAVDEPAIATVA